MKTTRFLISLFLATVSLSISAQNNSDIPKIELFAVEVHSVNDRVEDHRGDNLSENGGYVNIPPESFNHDGTSDGIIIVHDFTDHYFAYERRCPVCHAKGQHGVFTLSGLLVAKCNNCSAEAQNIVAWGSGQLCRYNYKGMGPGYLIPYVVREEPRGDKLYLIIYPN